MALFAKVEREKSFSSQISSRISISHPGKDIETDSVALFKSIYTSSLTSIVCSCEKALFNCSGLAFFHCSTVRAGKILDSFKAYGQDSFFFPLINLLTSDWSMPKIWDMCFCFIMFVILLSNITNCKYYFAILSYFFITT